MTLQPCSACTRKTAHFEALTDAFAPCRSVTAWRSNVSQYIVAEVWPISIALSGFFSVIVPASM